MENGLEGGGIYRESRSRTSEIGYIYSDPGNVPGIDNRAQSSLHSLLPTFRDADPIVRDQRRQLWIQLAHADPERMPIAVQASRRVEIWRWRKGMHQERDSRGVHLVLLLSLGLGLKEDDGEEER